MLPGLVAEARRASWDSPFQALLPASPAADFVISPSSRPMEMGPMRPSDMRAERSAWQSFVQRSIASSLRVSFAISCSSSCSLTGSCFVLREALSTSQGRFLHSPLDCRERGEQSSRPSSEGWAEVIDFPDSAASIVWSRRRLPC